MEYAVRVALASGLLKASSECVCLPTDAEIEVFVAAGAGERARHFTVALTDEETGSSSIVLGEVVMLARAPSARRRGVSTAPFKVSELSAVAFIARRTFRVVIIMAAIPAVLLIVFYLESRSTCR